MSKRSLRRHHSERMKAKARKIHWMWQLWPLAGWKLNDRAAHYADHLKMCSCSMCGNPRKWLKEITRQEAKFELLAKEQIDELVEPIVPAGDEEQLP